MSGASKTTARLLLIEDEPTVARLTRLVLSSEGYSVDVLADHQAAAERAASANYDLIMADTELGSRTAGLAGLSPLIEAAAPTPVLLFSAHRFPESAVVAAGLAGVVQKPYDIDDLLRVVQQTLSSRTPDANANQPTAV